MRKRIVLIMAIIIIALSCVVTGVLVKKNKDNNNEKSSHLDDNGCVTRYEWIEMLCEKFGMIDYYGEEPYFSDIDMGNEYYSYIQAAVEWGILNENEEFKGEKAVSGNFVVLTAMKAIGEYKIQLYLESTDELTDIDYINFALEQNVLPAKGLLGKLERKECEKILDKVWNMYNVHLWKDDYSDIKYKENIVQLSETDIENIASNYSKIEVKGELINALSEGDIIVFSNSIGIKIAKRIIKIEDSILLLEDVDLEDVIEEITFSDIAFFPAIELDTYIEAGLEAVSYAEDIRASEEYQTMPVWDFNKKMDGIAVSVSKKDEEKNLTVKICNKITDNEKEFEIPLDSEGNLDIGWEINGINVASSGKISTIPELRIEEADILLEANSNLEIKLMEMKIDEEIKLFKLPVPLAGGVASVDIEFYLVLTAEGEAIIKAEVPAGIHLNYKEKCGFRNVCYNEKIEITAEAQAELSTGARIEPILGVLGYSLVDAELDIMGEGSAEIKVWEDFSVCSEVEIVAPAINLSVLADDEKEVLMRMIFEDKEGEQTQIAEALDIELPITFEIISEEKAPFRKSLHYEIYVNGSSGYVNECTHDKELKGRTQESLENVELAKYYNYPYPLEFWFEEGLEDCGDYYVAVGTIACADCIGIDEYNALEEGESFEVNGVKYSKGEKLTQDEQREGEKYRYADTFIVNEDGDKFWLTQKDDEHFEKNELIDNNLYVIREDLVSSFCNVTVLKENIKVRISKDAKINLAVNLKESNFEWKNFSAQECYEKAIKDVFGCDLVSNLMADGYGMYGRITVDENGYIDYWSEGIHVD